MAQYNEILVGRFNRFFQKYLQMKGPAPAPQLATELTPSLSFELELDTWYLQGWEPFGLYSSIAPGGVGTQAVAVLRNPVGSGVITIVDDIWAENSGATASSMPILYNRAAVTTDDQATLLTPPGLDNRGRSRSATRFTSGAAALSAGFLNVRGAILAVNQNWVYINTPNQAYCLPPGSAIAVRKNVLNEGFEVAFSWRERPLEESEFS